jgi:hypothetical protein
VREGHPARVQVADRGDAQTVQLVKAIS